MNTGLIVIDMQWAYPLARHESLRRCVKKQIQLAKRRQAPILLVEYIDDGPTLPDLFYAASQHNHCYTITKEENDGTLAILAFLAEFPHFIPTWRVCGIHLDSCVWDTVLGLRNSLGKTKLEIAKDAVSPNISRSKSNLFKILTKKGIKVI